jgi:peptidoglycan/xylan/chitin deacetylase (PgdA/CDA1 family)
MKRTRQIPCRMGLFFLAFLGFAFTALGAMALQPPRMVLNRSLFLEWDKASATNFTVYEVHASTQQGFTPSDADRVAAFPQIDLHYTRLHNLQPSTRYYFRVLTITSSDTATSAEVTATTLADGVGESRIPTVMYHHVQPRTQFPPGFDPGGWCSTQNFTRDMDYLKSHGVNAVGVTEILDRLYDGTPLPPNPVFITFDDGYVTYLQNAVPILLAHDYQSVNAIVTRKTGGSSDWAVPEWPLMSLMTWTQVKDCQRQGMWMGAHTQTHVDLDLEPEKAYQIAGSRDDLINHLHVHPRYFCYPWGMGGHRVQSILDQTSAAGYTLATRTWPPSIATVNSERLWFPRVFANQNDTLRDFLVKLELDTDKDGIKDYVEMDWGLDASKADTDGDGLSDGFEVAYDGNAAAYNPYHPTDNPGGVDLDVKRPDTDLDGLSDFDELHVYGTNPLRADTDGDGLSDADDVLHANPLKADTDGDGIPDGLEVHFGMDPRVSDGRRPFTGAAVPVPGCVEVEDFDYGGAGLAYSDTTVANAGGAYRPFERVDLAVDNSASNHISLGWTQAGEWLTYSLSVATSGYCKIAVRLSAQGTGGVFHLELDDVDVSGPMPVPHSGGWSNWRVVESPPFHVAAGARTLKLAMDGVGPSGNVAAFDRLCFIALPPPGPYGGIPQALPGTVEMEDFDEGGSGSAYSDTTPVNEGGQYRLNEGVDISRDTAAGNSHVVGWTTAGEWLQYTVNVASSANYTVETRVSGVGTGGQFRILVNGTDKTGVLAVPNTGAWNVYQTVSKTGVALSSGIQTVRVVMVTAGTSGHVGAFDWFRVREAPPAPPRLAFPSGTPWALPGTVEIENFDSGGPGVAYGDATPANEGGQYRVDDGVDIARDTGAGNSNVVGWTKAGEWMEYTVNLSQSGTYTLETRVAAVGAGGQFRLEFNGVDKTGSLTVPNTGAWNVYQTVPKTGVSLSSGIQTVRVVMVTAGTSGHVGAFDWFRVVSTVAPFQSAYPSGTPWALPGTVEAENFDNGGPGVAYGDATPANEGRQYRLNDSVDIARDTNAGNSHVVGWTPAGEWLEYTVNVTLPGTYALDTRVAGVGTGGQFRIVVDGVDKTGLMAVPNTGTWNAYQIVQRTGVALSSGIQTVRVEMVTAGISGHVGAFDWFRVSAAPLSVGATMAISSSAVVSPLPVEVRTSQEEQQPAAGWLAMDGDTHTAWQGLPGGGGWWLALVYDPPVAVTGLTIDWAAESPTNVQFLRSLEEGALSELTLPLTNGPVDLNCLWLIIPNTGSNQAPAIREIQIE